MARDKTERSTKGKERFFISVQAIGTYAARDEEGNEGRKGAKRPTGKPDAKSG